MTTSVRCRTGSHGKESPWPQLGRAESTPVNLDEKAEAGPATHLLEGLDGFFFYLFPFYFSSIFLKFI